MIISKSYFALIPKCYYYSKNKFVICPECNSHIDDFYLKNFPNMTYDCVYFGWEYFKYYEKKYKISPSTIHLGKPFILPPSELLLLIGSYILTSIISGITYDIFKKKIVKILKRRNISLNDVEDQLKGSLKDFYNHMEFYYNEIFKKKYKPPQNGGNPISRI